MHLFLPHVSIFRHSKPHAAFLSLSNRGRFATPSSSGSGSDVGGQHLPLPMAYGTHVLHESGYLPNKTHSNTAGKWHWHKKREQIFHHSVHPGIHHTSGHLAHMALPPPRKWEKNVLVSLFRNHFSNNLKCVLAKKQQHSIKCWESRQFPREMIYHTVGKKIHFVLELIIFILCFMLIIDHVIK